MTRYLILGAVICMAACSQQKDDDLVEMDLLSHGMPVVVKAPEDALIEKMDLVVQQDLTIRKGDDYYIQIFESDARNNDEAAIKQQLLSDVQSNPYFDEIVENDENGFVYKNTIDSTYINYGFRYVKIQGDKEYVFQQGMRGKFSLEAIRRMYEAVQ
jgi:hypothetical protein